MTNIKVGKVYQSKEHENIFVKVTEVTEDRVFGGFVTIPIMHNNSFDKETFENTYTRYTGTKAELMETIKQIRLKRKAERESKKVAVGGSFDE